MKQQVYKTINLLYRHNYSKYLLVILLYSGFLIHLCLLQAFHSANMILIDPGMVQVHQVRQMH